ncbi:hypothetical protein F511_27912 [Dorcoceras hygrometricum]|uniref:Uncharacterized protein n=1 Tax=Dorcoceras hygrometricum TaxID=472368 RepID=A0A2Z7CUR4_9LAMI|nr:hypothetical protein F511_27912 [Dorcoceras hygrometricum]
MCGRRFEPWIGLGEPTGLGGGPVGGVRPAAVGAGRHERKEYFRGIEMMCGKFTMSGIKIPEPMNPCSCIKSLWIHVITIWGSDNIKIEHAGPLGSLGLNGTGDDPTDFIPTDGEDL